MLSPVCYAYHDSHRYTQLFHHPGITEKVGHIERVIKLFEDFPTLFISYEMDRELTLICAEHHDDGRIVQFQKTGQFDDNHFPYQDAGAKMLDEFCIANGTPFRNFPEDIVILRNVMLYHGKIDFSSIGHVLPTSIPYIRAITCANDLENCISCIFHSKLHYDNDEKGLSYEHRISPEVRKWYANGEKFNKLQHCTTYDEYVLYAGMLAIKAIKQYGFVAQELFKKPDFGYSSIALGFCTIFHSLLLPQDADWAYSIMCEYIYDN